MVLVESIREILKSDENVTPADIAKKLDLQLEVAIDILKELRRA